ncbi:MAG: hypothetical protein MUC49_13475 [Raineya sp.]|jgi:hypothetical protein|nr:hypothetical protein [Raineya sp.]
MKKTSIIPLVIAVILIFLGIFLQIQKQGLIVFGSIYGIALCLLAIYVYAKNADNQHNKVFKEGIPTLGEVLPSQGGALSVKIKTLDKKEVIGEIALVVYKNRKHPLSYFNVGMRVPIRYDAQNPKKMILEMEMDKNILQELFDQEFKIWGITNDKDIEIRKKGTKASGVIIASEATGKLVNNHTEMKLTVKITKPNGEMYETTLYKVVLAVDIHLTQVGRVHTFFYEEQHPNNAVLVFQDGGYAIYL